MAEISIPCSSYNKMCYRDSSLNWATVWGGDGTKTYTDSLYSGHKVSALGLYDIYRCFIDFPTSFLGPDIVINNAKIRLHLTEKPGLTGTESSVYICKGAQDLPVPVSAYQQHAGVGAICGIKAYTLTSDLTVNQYNDFPLSDPHTLIEKEGITKVFLTNYSDRLNINPNDSANVIRTIIFKTYADGEGYYPLLTINYELALAGMVQAHIIG